MNKQNLWFLTLFSLILVLGVYYITLPNEIFQDSIEQKVSNEIDSNIIESNKLISERVQRDERVSEVMSELQNKIVSSDTNSEEKNVAFEELQLLNLAKGKESFLEDKIKNNFKFDSIVCIENSNITITISGVIDNNKIINEIMRSVQEEFDERQNIVIKFK